MVRLLLAGVVALGLSNLVHSQSPHGRGGPSRPSRFAPRPEQPRSDFDRPEARRDDDRRDDDRRDDDRREGGDWLPQRPQGQRGPTDHRGPGEHRWSRDAQPRDEPRHPQHPRFDHERRDHDDADHRREEYRHEERREEYREVERTSGISALSRSINAELLDIAAALRGLDQSYMYQGFRNGDHAWVAGSSFLQKPTRVEQERIRLLRARVVELEARLEREHRIERERRVEECPVPVAPKAEQRSRCDGFTWRAGQPLKGERRGKCYFNEAGVLELNRGAYLCEDGIADHLTAACRKTNELTIEAVLTPASDDCRGPARILSLSTDSQSRNFTLGQDDDRLVLRLRTTENDDNGTNPEVSLCRLERGRKHHVIVTYRPGRIVCYLDGEQVLETGAVQGQLTNWSEQRFVLGDEATGERDWPGTLSSFAVYNCVITPKSRPEPPITGR